MYPINRPAEFDEIIHMILPPGVRQSQCRAISIHNKHTLHKTLNDFLLHVINRLI
jgi:hypothetical protein